MSEDAFEEILKRMSWGQIEDKIGASMGPEQRRILRQAVNQGRTVNHYRSEVGLCVVEGSDVPLVEILAGKGDSQPEATEATRDVEIKLNIPHAVTHADNTRNQAEFHYSKKLQIICEVVEIHIHAVAQQGGYELNIDPLTIEWADRLCPPWKIRVRKYFLSKGYEVVVSEPNNPSKGMMISWFPPLS